METKPRILYLQKILLERTDEENPLSTTQLINILNDEYGISAHRTTVTKDIAALQEFGMDIVTIHSTQSKYFVASRKFELPELKLLIDAVESSKFITKKKSKTLIEKIHTMTSPGQVAKLKRNNYVVNRIKPDNEQIYYIIDAINDAINAGKQISFQYYDYTGLKKKVLKNKGEVYKLSPYKLLWCGDYYYVLGYSPIHEKPVSGSRQKATGFPSGAREDLSWTITRTFGSRFTRPIRSTLRAAARKSIEPKPRYALCPPAALFRCPIRIIAHPVRSATSARRRKMGRTSFALFMSALSPIYACMGSRIIRRAPFCMIAFSMRSSDRVSSRLASSITSTRSRSASASIKRGLTVSPSPSSAVW